ncbi:hypothetical protein PM082_001748 [Marasmius tenuissimus]|nr:hypothetical protein PM082_001748 [Marasmius tenuissimus]
MPHEPRGKVGKRHRNFQGSLDHFGFNLFYLSPQTLRPALTKIWQTRPPKTIDQREGTAFEATSHSFVQVAHGGSNRYMWIILSNQPLEHQNYTRRSSNL